MPGGGHLATVRSPLRCRTAASPQATRGSDAQEPAGCRRADGRVRRPRHQRLQTGPQPVIQEHPPICRMIDTLRLAAARNSPASASEPSVGAGARPQRRAAVECTHSHAQEQHWSMRFAARGHGIFLRQNGGAARSEPHRQPWRESRFKQAKKLGCGLDDSTSLQCERSIQIQSLV